MEAEAAATGVASVSFDEAAIWLAGALLWDRFLGEPPTAAHPVVWIGRTIGALERRGMEIRTPPDWRKASVWVLRRNKHGKIVHATVWPPPLQ